MDTHLITSAKTVNGTKYPLYPSNPEADVSNYAYTIETVTVARSQEVTEDARMRNRSYACDQLQDYIFDGDVRRKIAGDSITVALRYGESTDFVLEGTTGSPLRERAKIVHYKDTNDTEWETYCYFRLEYERSYSSDGSQVTLAMKVMYGFVNSDIKWRPRYIVCLEEAASVISFADGLHDRAVIPMGYKKVFSSCVLIEESLDCSAGLANCYLSSIAVVCFDKVSVHADASPDIENWAHFNGETGFYAQEQIGDVGICESYLGQSPMYSIITKYGKPLYRGTRLFLHRDYYCKIKTVSKSGIGYDVYDLNSVTINETTPQYLYCGQEKISGIPDVGRTTMSVSVSHWESGVSVSADRLCSVRSMYL